MNGLGKCAVRVAVAGVVAGGFVAGVGAREAASPVSLEETAELYILDNGILHAQVAKASGDLVSLRYRGREMFATFLKEDGEPDLVRDPPGENLEGLNRGMTDHQYGFWSHDAMGKRGSGEAIAEVTTDPRDNGGERAEVSVKGTSGGTRALGTGPGAGREDGDFFADVEIRYALGRGEAGIHTYCIFEHKPEYPADSITEARFCMKLHDRFDWMLNDPLRNKRYRKDDYENKYNYTANQFRNRAFGWASTGEGMGCFLINPSMEYMSGGPTKYEFLTHRDTNPVAAPCVLNYWRSSHYGGAVAAVDAGEHWRKVIGPFLIYCNEGSDPQALLRDAQAKQAEESGKWPYPWVECPDYPTAGGRGGVTGRLVLNDPGMPGGGGMSNVMVGLTHPDYEVPLGPGGRRVIGWQQDAKFYQFWVWGGDDGTFTIPHVHPGAYTLRAFADGVLGEYAKAGVTVEAGRMLELGPLEWTPVRRGRQVWEVGIPNRNSREFLKGDDYFHDGMSEMYADLFPEDVDFAVGRSDFRTDMYFQHVPRATPESLRAAQEYTGPFWSAPRVTGTATPWTIRFDLPGAPAGGAAVLRLAISGTGTRALDVQVNGHPAGEVVLGMGDGTFSGRNGIQGIWYERELAFAAALLLAGENTLTLTVPAGPVGAGVMYDSLRLELDDSAAVTGPEAGIGAR